MTTDYPQRVVAVAPGGSKRGFAYMTAAVYELKPRKDGTLTYRRSDSRYGVWPHRSLKLATADAQELAEELNVPLWKDVRQHMPAEQARALHQ